MDLQDGVDNRLILGLLLLIDEEGLVGSLSVLERVDEQMLWLHLCIMLYRYVRGVFRYLIIVGRYT